MGSLIPLSDGSRRPMRFATVTFLLIVVGTFVFILELADGDAFVTQWSAIPAEITSGNHLTTIRTAKFMHGSRSHIISNMRFLRAFGPEVEDAMNRVRYFVFYLVGGVIAMLTQVAASPHSTVPNLGAGGAIATDVNSGGVAYLAHIGSMIFGAVTALLFADPGALN